MSTSTPYIVFIVIFYLLFKKDKSFYNYTFFVKKNATTCILSKQCFMFPKLTKVIFVTEIEHMPHVFDLLCFFAKPMA